MPEINATEENRGSWGGVLPGVVGGTCLPTLALSFSRPDVASWTWCVCFPRCTATGRVERGGARLDSPSFTRWAERHLAKPQLSSAR